MCDSAYILGRISLVRVRVGEIVLGCVVARVDLAVTLIPVSRTPDTDTDSKILGAIEVDTMALGVR